MCHPAIKQQSSRLNAFLKMPFHDKINLLRWKLYLLKGVLYYRNVFGSFGQGSVLFRPLLLANPRFIYVGKKVTIRPGARIEVICGNANRIPQLRIGHNVNIEQNVHLVCHSSIVIGNNVSITGNCAIVDVIHPYEDVRDPVKVGARILDEDSHVEIGDGSFLGFGALVMPGVRIGKYCIVGAKSVVTKDVPDYSVATGIPAKVVRKYDTATGKWSAV